MIYEIIVAILFFLVLIIASLLLVPFHVSLRFSETAGSFEGNLDIRWMGLTFIRGKISPEGRKKELGPKEKKRYKKRRRGLLPSEQISRFMEALPHLPALLRMLLRSIHLENLSCDISVGLGDPVYTAEASWILWSLASLINASPRAHLSASPDFVTDRLDGCLAGELRIRLMWIAFAVISGLTNRPVRRLFLGMRG